MASPDLWTLARRSPQVDPSDLLVAVETECRSGERHDFRTRLLIRDSLRALTDHWGRAPLWGRMSDLARRASVRVEAEDLGEAGFPTLTRRLMPKTTPEEVLNFLRELGRAARSPCRIDVGGSTALILRDLLARQTDDVDAVDEVPAALRTQHDLMNSLAQRYGLRLTHFQSHYLPAGWADRVGSLGVFGQMSVFLVDPVDIAVGKLFSRREKDLDDVRVLRPQLDWPAIVDRLRRSAGPLRSDAVSLAAAEHNWYILTGDPLPDGI